MAIIDDGVEVTPEQAQAEVAAENAAAENKPEAAEEQHLVLYGDGGCRPNPGPGGWGMHGYMFIPKVPTKNMSHAEYVCTAKGYVSKGLASTKMTAEGKEDRRRYDRAIEVTPVHYVDGYGSFANDVTNNVAEIEAATQAMKHGAQYAIKSLLYKTDSEHVVQGLNSWTKSWAKNNWLKHDGVPPANVDYWKRLVESRDWLVSRGVEVKVEWVKAHTDDSLVHDTILGNVMADKLATAGIMASRMKQAICDITTTSADGYWKYAPERHPFIANRRMYFNTLAEYIKDGEYYLGEHGKDDDVFGKRTADGAFAVVKLKQPDPVLETVRKHQSHLANGADSIVMARLDQIYQPGTHQELFEMGAHAMVQRTPYRLDLEDLKKQPLTREFKPPRLAMRAVDAISELSEKLELFLAKDPRIVVTDLTSILYETTVKNTKKAKGKTEEKIEVKLKSEYNVGFAALHVDANYETSEGVKSAPVTLTLGIDMLDRNALKRLEDKDPKVSLISWLESPNCFRYATVIETNDGIGIWAGVYSNQRIVT